MWAINGAGSRPPFPSRRIAPNVSVTVVGHRPAIGADPWTVEQIRLHEPGLT